MHKYYFQINNCVVFCLTELIAFEEQLESLKIEKNTKVLGIKKIFLINTKKISFCIKQG